MVSRFVRSDRQADRFRQGPRGQKAVDHRARRPDEPSHLLCPFPWEVYLGVAPPGQDGRCWMLVG